MESKKHSNIRTEAGKIFDAVWNTPDSLPRKIMEARPLGISECESEIEEDILRFKANLPAVADSFEQAAALIETSKRS